MKAMQLKQPLPLSLETVPTRFVGLGEFQAPGLKSEGGAE